MAKWRMVEASEQSQTTAFAGPAKQLYDSLLEIWCLVHIIYIDDSGDSQIRAYSALAIPVTAWNEAFSRILAYRRLLKARDGIFVRVEFHATDFVAGRGNISKSVIPKGARCRIFKETLSEVAALPGIRVFNGIARRDNDSRLFERLLNRINTSMVSLNSQTIIISDEGKDFTPLVRKLRVYNPVASQFGVWPGGQRFRNIPLDRIVEDLFFRKSESSYFIQMADFCAYALFRSEYQLPSKVKYGLHEAFEILRPVCTPECHRGDGRRLGIIRV